MTSTTATPYAGLRGLSARELQDFSRGSLPDWLGIELTSVRKDRLTCRVPVRRDLLGPHGYLHGGALVTVADSLCGYGAVVTLPAGANGFLTAELRTSALINWVWPVEPRVLPTEACYMARISPGGEHGQRARHAAHPR